MDQSSYGKQVKSPNLILARLVFGLGVFGILFALPFVLFAGLGFLVIIPLTLFLKEQRNYMRKIAQNKPLAKHNYYVYVVSAILTGLACVYGFRGIASIWGFGEEHPKTPVLLVYIYTCVVPAITILILLNVTLYNHRRRATS